MTGGGMQFGTGDDESVEDAAGLIAAGLSLFAIICAKYLGYLVFVGAGARICLFGHVWPDGHPLLPARRRHGLEDRARSRDVRDLARTDYGSARMLLCYCPSSGTVIRSGLEA